jgi:hypothetical protein
MQNTFLPVSAVCRFVTKQLSVPAYRYKAKDKKQDCCHVALNPVNWGLCCCHVWFQILPFCEWGLWCCHVSYSSAPYFMRASVLWCVSQPYTCLPVEEGFDTVMWSMTSDPISPIERALMEPRVPWLSKAACLKFKGRRRSYNCAVELKCSQDTRMTVLQWSVRGAHAWQVMQWLVRLT